MKVTFDGVTKRVHIASNDLDELKIFLWNRFAALRNEYDDPGVLLISAELPREAGAAGQS